MADTSQVAQGYSRVVNKSNAQNVSPPASQFQFASSVFSIRGGSAEIPPNWLIVVRGKEISAGLFRSRRIIWHDLRRPFATRLRANGVHEYDISDFLGHSRPGVTKSLIFPSSRAQQRARGNYGDNASCCSSKGLRVVPRAGVEPARPFGQRILSPVIWPLPSLTKRYEPVFTRLAVVKVSLRLA